MTSPKFAVEGESGRFYTIPAYPNVTFRSVTNALNIISKPALVPWAAKQVAERAYTSLSILKDMKKEPALKFLKAAPSEYTKASQERGTAVHKACENHTLGATIPAGEIGSYVAAYDSFLANEGFNVVAQELTVYSPEYGYAGSLDAIVERNGKHYVMDIKTGGVYPTASLQMAAYRFAPEKIDENGICSPQDIDIEGAFVLELKPNKYKIHYMDVSIHQFETFLRALELAAWQDIYSKSVIGDKYA